MNISLPVVVGTDGSPAAEVAVRWAAEEASLRGCDLRLVYAMESVEGFLPGMEDPLASAFFEQDVKTMLAKGALLAKATAAKTRAIDVSTDILRGAVVPNLLTESKDAQLFVVGSRGRGAISRAILGSVSSTLARHGHCPIAVIHEHTPMPSTASSKPVVVGVDGSPNSEPAIGYAMAQASRRGVSVRAVYAWSDFSGVIAPRLDWSAVVQEQHVVMAESMAGWQEQFPEVVVERVVVPDNPVRNLLEQSRDAQMVVVGSHGRGGFLGMLLGSTSQSLVHAVECPIVVVRRT